MPAVGTGSALCWPWSSLPITRRNELDACLQSLLRAARWPALGGESVIFVVALDSCTDNSEAVARRAGVDTVSLQARNVGRARAAGADLALARGARWLAFTDADTVVAPNWLHAQLALRCEAVCGTVGVRDWGDYGATLRQALRPDLHTTPTATTISMARTSASVPMRTAAPAASSRWSAARTWRW